MKNINLKDTYLKFFESKGHLRLPSFPLVPQNDKDSHRLKCCHTEQAQTAKYRICCRLKFCSCGRAILHTFGVQNDKCSALIKVLKGVRGESPNIDSEDCGECRESQGSPSKAQASRWRKRNENREEIFPASERSEQGLKFPRFVAGVAFHTCAAFKGGGDIRKSPGLWLLSARK